MTSDITKCLKDRWRAIHREERAALAEVLCNAYKDATGTYPSDGLREALYDAIEGHPQ